MRGLVSDRPNRAMRRAAKSKMPVGCMNSIKRSTSSRLDEFRSPQYSQKPHPFIEKPDQR